jgi:hypothetical protein
MTFHSNEVVVSIRGDAEVDLSGEIRIVPIIDTYDPVVIPLSGQPYKCKLEQSSKVLDPSKGETYSLTFSITFDIAQAIKEPG